MKHFAVIMIMVFVLSACGPAPTPAATPDTQATISSISGTMIAGTLTAQPSATPQPTETPQPSPTATTVPSATPDLSATPTLSATPDPLTPGAPTPTIWTGTFAPGNIEGLPTGFLRIENQTGQEMVMITLQGVTLTREQPITYNFSVTKATVFTVLWASYKYIIQVPNKKIYTGDLRIANKDKTTIRIYLNKDPVIVGP